MYQVSCRSCGNYDRKRVCKIPGWCIQNLVGEIWDTFLCLFLGLPKFVIQILGEDEETCMQHPRLVYPKFWGEILDTLLSPLSGTPKLVIQYFGQDEETCVQNLILGLILVCFALQVVRTYFGAHFGTHFGCYFGARVGAHFNCRFWPPTFWIHQPEILDTPAGDFGYTSRRFWIHQPEICGARGPVRQEPREVKKHTRL